uniref:Uncharacterized protein n=1 Tax=Lepeophtheirus salmonis TaxID=72036 RepID=A0A0K2TUS9_LEPSM
MVDVGTAITRSPAKSMSKHANALNVSFCTVRIYVKDLYVCTTTSATAFNSNQGGQERPEIFDLVKV